MRFFFEFWESMNFVFVDWIGVITNFDFEIVIAEDIIKLNLGRTD